MSKIYIVATPIGNLKDITYRAIEIFKETDFIICEDTRVTGFLLNHFEIKKEMISLNAQSENRKIDFILEKIQSGKTAALVSDAGTPCISDPGVRIISAAVKRGIEIIPIPGVSALTTALSIAGVPTDSFVFEGFLPQKKGRQKLLKQIADDERTTIIYESSHRIEKLLNELKDYMPERFVVVCRELTKKFEEILRGTPEEISVLLKTSNIKGEFVVIISAKYYKKE